MVYQGYDPDYFEKKVAITVATTGGLHGKEANPNLPEQPDEIAEQVRECEQAGASIVHLHARDESGGSTKDLGVFQELRDEIDARCDDILVNFTTAGSRFPPGDRLDTILETDPQPDIASLDMGPLNIGERTAPNPRDQIEQFAEEMEKNGIKPEIELFHPGQISEFRNLIEKDLVSKPYYCNLIFGMQTATEPHPRNLVNFIDNLPEGVEWSCLAIGRHQLPLTTMGLILGGNIRVGMEDNVYYQRGELAESNAQLVRRVVRIAKELDRDIATPQDVRERLDL